MWRWEKKIKRIEKTGKRREGIQEGISKNRFEFDEYYLKYKSFLFDMKILWMTLIKVFKQESVQH
jgi:lipopolysaccharide/colanic/teichoic acid biosynthesis glycosyltransferase